MEASSFVPPSGLTHRARLGMTHVSSEGTVSTQAETTQTIDHISKLTLQSAAVITTTQTLKNASVLVTRKDSITWKRVHLRNIQRAFSNYSADPPALKRV